MQFFDKKTQKKKIKRKKSDEYNPTWAIGNGNISLERVLVLDMLHLKELINNFFR